MDELAQRLDNAIAAGLHKAKRIRRRRIARRAALSSASVLIAALLLSIRFSPVVAAYVEDIPGLNRLAELFRYDKGLQLAAVNDFMQPLGLTAEQDGIEVVIDGLIADESRIVLLYTLNNKDKVKRVANVRDISVTDAEGKELEAGISYGSVGFEEGWETKSGQIDITFAQSRALPDALILELAVDDVRAEPGRPLERAEELLRFELPIDHTKYAGKQVTYPIGRMIEADGQRITFGELTIHPTRMALDVHYDPSNTKEVFYFNDLVITDENGETFGTIANGVSASTIDEFHEQLYFQSNYFLDPKELYLRGSGFRALDKDALEVIVDIEAGALLKRPDDRLKLVHADRSMLEFELDLTGTPNDRGFGIFDHEYRDEAGHTYDLVSSGSSHDTSTAHSSIQLVLSGEPVLGPITLTIHDYPAHTVHPIDIRVK